jgi:alcohol dehydrogenase
MAVEQLSLRDVRTPQPGPYEVLLKVHATSLNGFDPMILQGTTDLKTPLPMTHCGDIAGEIVALGSKAGQPNPDVSAMMSLFDASSWKIGDRVLPHPFVMGEGMTGETRVGACGEYIAFPVSNLIPIPDEVSYEQAACLPIAYGTAYRMLVTVGKIRARETVVILGATGGVGTCAVQLAKVIGATVIAVGRGAERVARLADLGADHVIDTEAEDLVDACRQIAGKPRMLGRGGVDVVINYVGGDTWEQSLKVIRHGGRMLTCGASAGHTAQTDLRYVWTYELQLLGSNGWYPTEQVAMLGLVAGKRLEPIIDRIVGLGGVANAMQDLIDRKVFGKVVIKP